MKVVVPNYYNQFKCIAEKCHHNCCIGWEIDIDEDTFEYYQEIGGTFGKRLKKDITVTNDYACFNLDGKGRCAFLNKDNLCDIILNLGENSLCQVCSDHPRFRNYYDNEVEIGLGLCCEEAGRIILGQEEKFEIIVTDEDSDNESVSDFLEFKRTILDNLQNDKYTFKKRISRLLKENSIEFSEKDFIDWIDFYLSLERLDDSWTNLLCDMKTVIFNHIDIPEEYIMVLEKLLIYFIYRHK